jgi:hypothetical protein
MLEPFLAGIFYMSMSSSLRCHTNMLTLALTCMASQKVYIIFQT